MFELCAMATALRGHVLTETFCGADEVTVNTWPRKAVAMAHNTPEEAKRIRRLGSSRLEGAPRRPFRGTAGPIQFGFRRHRGWFDSSRAGRFCSEFHVVRCVFDAVPELDFRSVGAFSTANADWFASRTAKNTIRSKSTNAPQNQAPRQGLTYRFPKATFR
jgi:hypothetical protein